MQPSIKRLFIVFLFPLLFVDCNKDDTIGLCQLQSDSFDLGTTTATTYVYDAQRLMSQTTTAPGYSYALSYHYGLDGLIDVANAVKNGATGKITYAYGINKQLAQSISIFGTDTVTTIYTYNDNGQVTKSIQAYVGAVLTDSITVDHTYPDLLTRNPSSKVITHGGAIPDTTVYQYDTKINPFREFFPSIQAFNNVTRIEASGGTPVIIGYTYNELGYPVSATWSSGETQTFSYKCE